LTDDEVRFRKVQCAFISLDPERIGENLNDSSVQDFGDNKSPHFKGTASTVRAYLQGVNDEINSDDEDVDQLGFLPASVQEFLSG